MAEEAEAKLKEAANNTSAKDELELKMTAKFEEA